MFIRSDPNRGVHTRGRVTKSNPKKWLVRIRGDRLGLHVGQVCVILLHVLQDDVQLLPKPEMTNTVCVCGARSKHASKTRAQPTPPPPNTKCDLVSPGLWHWPDPTSPAYGIQTRHSSMMNISNGAQHSNNQIYNGVQRVFALVDFPPQHLHKVGEDGRGGRIGGDRREHKPRGVE